MTEPARPKERRRAMSGNQLGDPGRAGQALLTVLDAETPPGHLILGSGALRLVAETRRAFDAETTTWESLSTSTDLPGGAQRT